jgi:TPR repeat protein
MKVSGQYVQEANERFMTRVLITPLLAAAILLYCITGASADYAGARKLYDAGEFDRAFHEMKRLAGKGDMRAQFYLGRMYHLGQGRTIDLQEAAAWYGKSARKGFARAQNNLGILLYDAGGDIDAAIVWFRKAADQGLLQGRQNLELAQRMKGRMRNGDRRGTGDPSMEFRFHRLREGLH